MSKHNLGGGNRKRPCAYRTRRKRSLASVTSLQSGGGHSNRNLGRRVRRVTIDERDLAVDRDHAHVVRGSVGEHAIRSSTLVIPPAAGGAFVSVRKERVPDFESERAA